MRGELARLRLDLELITQNPVISFKDKATIVANFVLPILCVTRLFNTFKFETTDESYKYLYLNLVSLLPNVSFELLKILSNRIVLVLNMKKWMKNWSEKIKTLKTIITFVDVVARLVQNSARKQKMRSYVFVLDSLHP